MPLSHESQKEYAGEEDALRSAQTFADSRRRRREVQVGRLIGQAVLDSFTKLRPGVMVHNPVMFVTEIGSAVCSYYFVSSLFSRSGDAGFLGVIAGWLWFTVLFANFAEAMAEGRGKAQADSLRKMKSETMANRVADGAVEKIPATSLRKGDIVLVSAGETIPGDGEVIEGIASVDESAITGESAPVIRESGGDRSAVTGGTRVLSDEIRVRITSEPGQTFLDRMIALVEGASRQKTPNEIALNILLAGLTIIFLLVVVTLLPFAVYSGGSVPITILIALLICLMPTTIGGLLSAIGIAGMDRLVKHNVLAMSGRAVEAAGDVDTLLLDKTGTITLGNRQATEFIPVSGFTRREVADAAQLASLSDETPEGRSIVVLAKKYGFRERHLDPAEAAFVPFSAHTRMSGLDVNGRRIRKGATEAVCAWVRMQGGATPADLQPVVEGIANTGGTPLVVARDREIMGVIHLKDVVKGGIRERFDHLRAMGIRTIMITGDNPLTAAAIAREAGVDDFLAQATPENKMELIKREQAQGKLVATAGGGMRSASNQTARVNAGSHGSHRALLVVDGRALRLSGYTSLPIHCPILRHVARSRSGSRVYCVTVGAISSRTYRSSRLPCPAAARSRGDFAGALTSESSIRSSASSCSPSRIASWRSELTGPWSSHQFGAGYTMHASPTGNADGASR
jgi:K+-transporting ATPase ATPase B chain